MKAIVCAFLVATLALSAAPTWAKSQTVKLDIVGPGLDQPLQITDPAILERFSIWVGPNSARQMAERYPNQEPRGAFADYLRGSLPPPADLTLYTVTFHQGGPREQMHEWHRTYVINYGHDPDSGQGYIYLPGPKDGEVYQRNVFSIGTGAEGKWFHASPAWERLVSPLIQQRSR